MLIIYILRFYQWPVTILYTTLCTVRLYVHSVLKLFIYVNSMPAESAAAVLERVDASGSCCVRGDRYSLRLYFKGVDNGDDSGQSVAHFGARYVVNVLLLILSVKPSACTSVVVVQMYIYYIYY
jgi:hypothetical protein